MSVSWTCKHDGCSNEIVFDCHSYSTYEELSEAADNIDRSGLCPEHKPE